VVARDQLRDEPEREQLDPDDDEEHAEQQQRSLPDRVAEYLDNRQVDKYDAADQAEQQAEPAE